MPDCIKTWCKSILISWLQVAHGDMKEDEREEYRGDWNSSVSPLQSPGSRQASMAMQRDPHAWNGAGSLRNQLSPQKVKCHVCDEEVYEKDSRHYGATSCPACKNFFKRNSVRLSAGHVRGVATPLKIAQIISDLRPPLGRKTR